MGQKCAWLTFFFLCAFHFLGTSISVADTQECVLKPDAGIVKATNEKTKATVATLKPGDFVYSRWTSGPLAAFVLKNGKFQEVTGLSEEILDCQSSGTSNEYPIVLNGNEGRLQLFNEFGIQNDPAGHDEGRKLLPKLPHKCFSIGAGHIGMEFTREAFAPYQKQGFNLNNLCMVMTSGQIKFDPETGQRLPTYVIADVVPEMYGEGKPGTIISPEYPFFAPPCFARGKTVVKGIGADMKPLGCTVNYHPWSGRRLAPDEVRVFTQLASLRAAGDAGEIMEDSRNLAKDAARLGSAGRLQAIKNLAPR